MKGSQLSQAIAAARQKHGISQGRLAELVGVNQPTIANWESGRHQPCRETYERLCRWDPEIRVVQANGIREISKPAGNPLGNPGKRSDVARENMARARIAAGSGVPESRVKALGLYQTKRSVGDKVAVGARQALSNVRAGLELLAVAIGELSKCSDSEMLELLKEAK